jgi:hypothetical protein
VSPTTLHNRMRAVPVPERPDAEDRVLAAALAAAPALARADSAYRLRPRRIVLAICALALVATVGLTAPGRSALSQAAELFGIGDVGGSPSSEQDEDYERGFTELNEPLVVDNGQAPDGSRYEWVAYRGKTSYLVDGERIRVRGFCVGLEWTGDVKGRSSGGSCGGSGGKQPTGVFNTVGVSFLQAPFERSPRHDLLLSGTTTPRIHRLRIRYQPLRGPARDLPVDFTRIDGELLRRAGSKRPFGTFIAVLPGNQARRDRLTERFRVTSLAPFLRRKAQPIAELPPEYRPYLRCQRRLTAPPRVGPFTAIAYDRRGRMIDRLPYIEGTRVPRVCEHLLPN